MTRLLDPLATSHYQLVQHRNQIVFQPVTTNQNGSSLRKSWISSSVDVRSEEQWQLMPTWRIPTDFIGSLSDTAHENSQKLAQFYKYIFFPSFVGRRREDRPFASLVYFCNRSGSSQNYHRLTNRFVPVGKNQINTAMYLSNGRFWQGKFVVFFLFPFPYFLKSLFFLLFCFFCFSWNTFQGMYRMFSTLLLHLILRKMTKLTIA